MRRGKGAIGLACVGAALLVLPAAGAGPGSTTRVSTATDGSQGNGSSFVPAISADGRYVAFYSDASNLVAGDTNGARDVFVRDLQTGETTRVSVSSSGAEANGDSFAPALSSDGRYVAFSSAGTNLVDGDTNDANDIFIRDRQANTTTRVSVGFDGSQANGGSDQPSLSGDGRLVAFTSTASNIVNGDVNNLRDAFVYDRQTGTAVNVSVDSNGVQGDLESSSPVLSADGKFVAYQSFADNLIPDDQNEGGDIFVRDLQANTTERVSEYTGHYEAEGDSQRPSISADGRYVAFDSDDWDLVWGDTNDSFDVFVNDRATTVTTRVSVDDSGTQSNSDSFRPVDQRRRALRRVLLGGVEPRLRRHERRDRRVRLRPAERRDEARERRRRRRGGKRGQRAPGHRRGRARRGLRIGRDEHRPRRLEPLHGHLRPRPARHAAARTAGRSAVSRA